MALLSLSGVFQMSKTSSGMCSTWEGKSGLSQVWVNGKITVKEFGFKGNLTEEPTIVLGQEQDSVGGGFDNSQSFMVMITIVHMWDNVISDCEIQQPENNLNFTCCPQLDGPKFHYQRECCN